MESPKSRFMDLACLEAEEGVRSKSGGPFGAVIVLNGRIVGAWHNCSLSAYDCTAHGEVQAIRQACKHLASADLSGCEIYTTCEPCPMCLGACYRAGLERVVIGATAAVAKTYGFDDVTFHQIIQRSPSAKSETKFSFGLLQDEAIEIIKKSNAYRKNILLGGPSFSDRFKSFPDLPPLVNECEAPKSAEANSFMREAFEQGKRRRCPLGAVVVKDGAVIGRGYEATEDMRDATKTAVVTALQEAGRSLKTHDLSGCELYALAEPDPMGLAAALWGRVTAAHFSITAKEALILGFEDPYRITQEIMLKQEDRKGMQFSEKVKENECEQLFKLWKKVNGILY